MVFAGVGRPFIETDEVLCLRALVAERDGLVSMPYANTEAMNRHLEEIAEAVAPGAHAIVVLDGAGWHDSADLVMPENITPIILPPYSPELNPVENVRRWVRSRRKGAALLLAGEIIGKLPRLGLSSTWRYARQ
jgi:hypothetical protein